MVIIDQNSVIRAEIDENPRAMKEKPSQGSQTRFDWIIDQKNSVIDQKKMTKLGNEPPPPPLSGPLNWFRKQKRIAIAGNRIWRIDEAVGGAVGGGVGGGGSMGRS